MHFIFIASAKIGRLEDLEDIRREQEELMMLKKRKGKPKGMRWERWTLSLAYIVYKNFWHRLKQRLMIKRKITHEITSGDQLKPFPQLYGFSLTLRPGLSWVRAIIGASIRDKLLPEIYLLNYFRHCLHYSCWKRAGWDRSTLSWIDSILFLFIIMLLLNWFIFKSQHHSQGIGCWKPCCCLSKQNSSSFHFNYQRKALYSFVFCFLCFVPSLAVLWATLLLMAWHVLQDLLL